MKTSQSQAPSLRLRRPAMFNVLVPRLAAVLALLLLPAFAQALDVTLRLVRAEAPDQLVSTAITTIDLDAERAQRQAEAEQAKAQAARVGQELIVPDEPVRPKAEFDRYCNYMRGIVIDRTHPFTRTYQGSYLGRSDVITLALQDGEHVIDPGGHRFTVTGDTIATRDPCLRPNGKTLDILAYAVTFMAIDGGAIRPMPAEVLRLPVTPRLYWGEEGVLPAEKLLASDATFKRLTLYMLANTNAPAYRLQPSGRWFHVTPEGVRLVDAGGRPMTDRGVYVEGKFDIVAPKFPVPVRLRGADIQLLVSGEAGHLSLKSLPGKKETVGTLYAFAAPEGAEVTAGVRARGAPLLLAGDLGEFPRRRILVDATATNTVEPRLLLTALSGYSVEAGRTLRVRVQYRDALDAGTLAPAEVAVYVWTPPVLGDDGVLQARPAPDAPLSGWRSLRVLATGQPDEYDVAIPDLPSNAYWLRLVVGRRGECTPAAALQEDYIEGVINPAARTVVSVFSPGGRHAFASGADIPMSVVIKSTVPVPGGRLEVRLSRGGQAFSLVSRDLPALPAGLHPLHFVLGGGATAALTPGDYFLRATLDVRESNGWTLHMARPRYRDDFPMFDHGWGTGNIDEGSLYANVPRDGIREANEQRAILRRNAEILGQQCNLNFTDFSVFRGFDMYEGRDSASEVAEVEMILRQNLSLPSHEVYYYPNHLESICEALADQGMGEFNALLDSFSPRSLCHSVQTELDSKMRQYQLSAELGERFENFVGMTLVKDDTTPTGDTEVGDAGRTVRLAEQARIFKEKHGFLRPPGGAAADYFQASLRGNATDAQREMGRQWETWAEDENCLLGDFYGMSRHAVDPILPRVRLGISGPGWGGTFSGGYPVTAHRNQSPLFVQTGSGDYGMQLILDPFLRTRFFQMTGDECWGNQGFHGTPGFYNLKEYLAGFLAAGATGFGYYHGRELEFTDSHRFYTLGVQEERQDIRDLLTVYGPLFRQMKPVADVGVLYPYHQTMYEVLNPDTPTGHLQDAHDLVYSCVGQLAFLGQNSEVLAEEMIDRGELGRFKAVIAPALHYLLPQHRVALEKYAAGGGLLLVGSRSTLVPAGARKIDDDFDECPEVNAKWSYNKLLDIGTAYLLGEMRRKAPVLGAALDPVVCPFAQAADDRVLVQTSRAGDGRYTIVWDQAYPSWMGTTRVCANPEWSNGGMEANESTLMPLHERVSFPAGATPYELFTQAPATNAAADGRVEAVADLAFTPFRIFVSLPKPITHLRIEAPAAVALGSFFRVQVTPLAADGQPLNAAVPLRATLLDGRGTNVWEVHGASFPTFDGRLAAPVTAAPGQWTVQVQELVSGREATVALETKPSDALPFGAQVTELGAADVQRPSLVKDFLASRKQDGETVLILLDESQAERRMAVAKEAGAALAKLGVKTEIERTDAPGVFAAGERVHLYQNWSEMRPAQYIDHPVVLLGGEGENVLIEELQENELLERRLTASYPGPGHGVLALVRSPFAYGRDVLGLFGQDDEGIRAAIQKLSDLGAAPSAAASVAAPALAVQVVAGEVKPGTLFAAMDGAPAQVVGCTASGARVAVAVIGYATNIFVYDAAGGLRVADKIGHLNTTAVQLLGDDGRMAVTSDGMTYLREADGRLRWKVRGIVYVDPAGRYVVRASGNGLAVLDLELKPLWKFDEFDQYATTQEILWGRTATFLGAFDDGATVAYRLRGKGPGIAGVYGDDVLFCDALTGKEKRRAGVDTAAIIAFAGRDAEQTEIRRLELAQNGRYAIATLDAVGGHPKPDTVLLDQDLKPLLLETFETPPYFGNKAAKTQRVLLADRRQVFTVGDTLCVCDPHWKTTQSVRTDNLILSMAVDEARGHIAVANYSGQVLLFDTNLKRLWATPVGSAAQLAFLPDGRLAAGTLRGEALLLSADGAPQWTASMNCYAEPASVERRWSELEAVPTPQGVEGAEGAPWWERLQANVDLGKDVAGLAGKVSAASPLSALVQGEPFGTYLVEWKYGPATGSGSLSLKIDEIENGAAGEKPNVLGRISRSAVPGAVEQVQRALLRLGDRPDTVSVSVQATGSGETPGAVTIRPLVFPSADLIRMPSLYRGEISRADRANPAVSADLFFNVAEKGSPHVTRWADPLAFVNGRMLESEDSLLGGKWFGTGNFFMGDNFMEVPCWIELTLPRKRVITHVVIAEDPNLPRVSLMSVDAYIESRETRKGLTEFEKRQLQRGFWQNVARRRNNTDVYNVFKLKEPVFTRKLRIYVLGGTSSISEVELYGALPKELEKGAK